MHFDTRLDWLTPRLRLVVDSGSGLFVCFSLIDIIFEQGLYGEGGGGGGSASLFKGFDLHLPGREGGRRFSQTARGTFFVWLSVVLKRWRVFGGSEGRGRETVCLMRPCVDSRTTT